MRLHADGMVSTGQYGHLKLCVWLFAIFKTDTCNVVLPIRLALM